MPLQGRAAIDSLAQAVARLLGWLTDLTTILVLGYIMRCWPTEGGAVTAGLLGVSSPLVHYYREEH